MGNKTDKSKPLHKHSGDLSEFTIKGNEEAYNEGEYATGDIKIVTKEKIQSGFMYIVFEGYEDTQWIERGKREVQVDLDGGISCNKGFVKVGGAHTICCQRYFILDIQEGLDQGTHEFVYNVELPIGMPGTFMFKAGGRENKKKAKVHYYLNAEIFKHKDSEKKDDLIARGKIPIFIRQAQRKYTDYDSKCTSKMKSSACSFLLDQGNDNSELTLVQDVCDPRENIELRYMADYSKIKSKIKEVKVRLIRKLVLRNSKDNKHAYREDILHEVSFDKKQDIASFVNPQEHSFSLKSISDKHIPSKKLNLFPPNGLQQSCYGYLVNMYYLIEVRGILDTIFVGNQHPKIAMPIDIIFNEAQMRFQHHQSFQKSSQNEKSDTNHDSDASNSPEQISSSSSSSSSQTSNKDANPSSLSPTITLS